LNRKIVALGAVFIAISLILGGVQDLYLYNIYGAVSNKWYFYAVITVILIIGIVLASWGLLKKEKTK